MRAATFLLYLLVSFAELLQVVLQEADLLFLSSAAVRAV